MSEASPLEASPSEPGGRAVGWAFALYVAVIGGIFAGLGSLAASHQDELRAVALRFVLPDDWVDPADWLVRGWLEKHRPALVNLLVTTVAVLVPMLTFPLKEWASARFEAHVRRGDADWQVPRSPSLAIQAWEEILLLIVFATLALGALRLSLTPGWERVGFWLTHGVLTFTYAVDFIGPTLARHHISPSDTYRALFLRFPFRALVFGALLSGPPMLVARALPALDPDTGFALLAGVNTLCTAIAVAAGTALGTRMVEPARGMRPSWLKAPVWGALLVGLGLNLAFFGGALRTALEVSPVLRCEWETDLTTLDFDLPGLSEPTLRIRFEVDVVNPTRRRARIGDNHVDLRHRGESLAETRLPPFDVPPGASVRQTIELAFTPRQALMKRGVGLVEHALEDGVWAALRGAASGAIDPQAYEVTLTVPLPTGELRVPLYQGAPGKR